MKMWCCSSWSSTSCVERWEGEHLTELVVPTYYKQPQYFLGFVNLLLVHPEFQPDLCPTAGAHLLQLQVLLIPWGQGSLMCNLVYHWRECLGGGGQRGPFLVLPWGEQGPPIRLVETWSHWLWRCRLVGSLSQVPTSPKSYSGDTLTVTPCHTLNL